MNKGGKQFFLSSTVLFVLFFFSLIISVGASSTMWNQTYGGIYHDRAESLVETYDGGFALAGDTYSFGAGEYDFWLVKADEHGIIPEFPSLIILPLLLIVTLFAVIVRTKIFRNSSLK
jgi:hypothetical protein